MDFRARLQAFDDILISSPEYTHGAPDSMKNALDWVVNSGEIYEKPVALVNTSMSATHAYASLMETLAMADADVVQEASVRVPLPTNRIDGAGIVSNPELSDTLRSAVVALAYAIKAHQARSY